MSPETWAYRLVRWTLSGVFLYAGAGKLLQPEALALIISDYGLVPQVLVMPVAVVLPAVEAAAAVGLLFDVRGSLSVITGLLVLFAFMLGYGIWLGLDIDCGCFGPGDLEAEVYHDLRPALYRDLVMIAGAVFLYWARCRKAASPSGSGSLPKP